MGGSSRTPEPRYPGAPVPLVVDTVRPVGTSGRVETAADGRPTDDALLDRVEALFSADPRLRRVNVTVDDRIIMLRGTVADQGTRDRAFSLAKSISGSRGVVAKFSGATR